MNTFHEKKIEQEGKLIDHVHQAEPSVLKLNVPSELRMVWSLEGEPPVVGHCVKPVQSTTKFLIELEVERVFRDYRNNPEHFPGEFSGVEVIVQREKALPESGLTQLLEKGRLELELSGWDKVEKSDEDSMPTVVTMRPLDHDEDILIAEIEYLSDIEASPIAVFCDEWIDQLKHLRADDFGWIRKMQEVAGSGASPDELNRLASRGSHFRRFVIEGVLLTATRCRSDLSALPSEDETTQSDRGKEGQG